MTLLTAVLFIVGLSSLCRPRAPFSPVPTSEYLDFGESNRPGIPWMAGALVGVLAVGGVT